MKPAFLLIGDPFLVEEKEKELLLQIGKNFKGTIERRTHRLTDPGLESILQSARTLPFSAAAQVFLLKNAEGLKKNQTELLADYFKHPSETSFLIFEADSMEKTNPLVALIQKIGDVVLLDDREAKSRAARFVRDKLRASGKTIAADAFAALEEQMGDAPVFLESVLDQLILYAGTKTQIDLEAVVTFQENRREIEPFQLAAALSARKTREAVLCLEKMLEENERDFTALVGLIHWQLRRLWKARRLLEEGAPETKILKDCRIWPKQAPYFMRELRAASLKGLEKSLEALFQLDWRLKTGRLEGRHAIESWVIQATS